MSITLEDLLELKRRRDELFAQLGNWAEVLRILREEYNRILLGKEEPGAPFLPVPEGPLPPLPEPLPIPDLPLPRLPLPGELPGETGDGTGVGTRPGVLGLALIAMLALSDQGGG